jgi:putative ABC transport system permease protein
MLRTTLKGVFAHKARLALTALAIILGVSFVTGTFIFTDTIDKTFNTLFEDSYAGTDVVVQAETEFEPGFYGPPPFDERVLSQVRAVSGVVAAEGNVVGYAQIIDKQGEAIAPNGPPTLGGNWLTDERLWGNLEVREGRVPTVAGEVSVDARTAADNDLGIGDRIDILVPIGRVNAEIVAITGFGESDSIAGATFAGFESREAQRVLDLVGQYQTISVVGEEGLDAAALRDRISPQLPAGFEAVIGADEAAKQAESLSSELGFIQTVLLVFAAIAVFVGAFIIQNTFRIIVAQRTRELALYRAIGASGGQIVRMVLWEALVVAVFASILGIGFGLAIASGLTALMSAAGFDLPSTSAELLPRTVIAGLVVGIIVTLVSSLLPAMRAARVPPMAAMREVESVPRGGLRRRVIAGGITLAAGIALIVNGLFGDVLDLGPLNELSAIGVGAFVVFIGVSILSALIVKPLARLIGAPVKFLGKVTGQLAEENSIRRPRRTAATASALMIGLALVGFFYILGDSLKASVGAAIDRGLRADFVLTPENFIGGMPPRLAADLAALPEVDAATALRLGVWDRDGSDDFLVGVDTTTADATMFLDIQEGSLEALAGGGVLVYDDTAKDKGWVLGDTVPMGFAATGLQQAEIVGIFGERDVLPNSASYLVGLDFYEANFAEQLDFAIGLKVLDGVAVEDARTAINAVAADYPNANVEDQAEFRATQAAQIDVLLNVFQAMLFLAVIIALLGITNTLVLSIFERTREIGLLRAVGMSRWQVRRMVLWESIIVAVIGGLLGLVVGVFFGVVVVAALGNLGVTELSIPGPELLSLLLIATLAGVLASIFPARRASRLNILEAISYE